MDDKGIDLLKQLISTIEGAPYPHTQKSELYSIWHEHALNIATDALSYVNSHQKHRKDRLPQSIQDETGLNLS
ncbi:hypothetical protein [Spirochaeta africana]|uniref:Uncharacterized protein n=1 Tax=Spirochaeta africana (strain ATCC 700263 / DSM 8902 / Z-7692) TaxID=889378 RepID=H9UJ49_SPIAZ|nr:hypothetical protein [Spirochaeta africana]AFG37542.1 hypothetical protein Spiaf_1481 [Spirochaeta africana DSM 8902]